VHPDRSPCSPSLATVERAFNVINPTDAVWFRTRKEDFVFCDFSDGSAICPKLNGRVQRRHRVVAGILGPKGVGKRRSEGAGHSCALSTSRHQAQVCQWRKVAGLQEFACPEESRSLVRRPAFAQAVWETPLGSYNLSLAGEDMDLNCGRGDAAHEVQRRNASNGGKGNPNVLSFRIVLLQSG
jgi:hypothetical protein